MTHYDTLGVSEDATHAEVVAAFRELVRSPDTTTDELSQAIAAYAVLGVPTMRAQYDVSSAHAAAAGSRPAPVTVPGGRKYRPRIVRPDPAPSTDPGPGSGGAPRAVKRPFGWGIDPASDRTLLGVILIPLAVAVIFFGVALAVDRTFKRDAAHAALSSAQAGAGDGSSIPGAPDPAAQSPSTQVTPGQSDQSDSNQPSTALSREPVTYSTYIPVPFFPSQKSYDSYLKEWGWTVEQWNADKGGSNAAESNAGAAAWFISQGIGEECAAIGRPAPEEPYVTVTLDPLGKEGLTGSYEIRRGGIGGPLVGTGRIVTGIRNTEYAKSGWGPERLASVTFGPTEFARQ